MKSQMRWGLFFFLAPVGLWLLVLIVLPHIDLLVMSRSLLALGGLVVSRSLRVGGNRFDEAIVAYVRRTQGSLIGEATAEQLRVGRGNGQGMAALAQALGILSGRRRLRRGDPLARRFRELRVLQGLRLTHMRVPDVVVFLDLAPAVAVALAFTPRWASDQSRH